MARRYYTRRRDIRKLRRGESIDFRKGKGYFVVPPLKPAKPLPEPAHPAIRHSLFSGKGIFTTTDSESVQGHHPDWIAWQLDPEGDETPYQPPGAIACYWQARPTPDVVGQANKLGRPYIAQAETKAEMDVALNLDLHVPKALVGNVSAWTAEQFNEAIKQRWDLILEWYWNEQPYYAQPDAGGYPLLRNVCFGTYPAESTRYRGNRVSVAQYRQVWVGPFSCWPAEGMTDLDWAAYDRA